MANDNYYGTLQAWQEPTRNETVAVGTSSTLVATQRNRELPRKAIIIRNNSPNPADIITINFGATPAVANAGIVLRQYESISDSTETGYDCWQGTINAICATANGSLSVFER